VQNLEWHLKECITPQEQRDGAWQVNFQRRICALDKCDGSIFHLGGIFSNDSLARKTFYNRDRNIIVEACYKGACRSIENFLLDERCPEHWKRLPRYHHDPKEPDDPYIIQKYYDILDSDPEIHTLVRDPIARLASAIRHMSDDAFKFTGIWMDKIDTFKYFEPRFTDDTHIVPQWCANNFEGDLDILKSKLKENFYHSYDQMLEDTDILEKMFSRTNHHWTELFFRACGGWYYNQDLFAPSDFMKSSKYYWVWDTKQEHQEFVANNHMIHLCHNLGYHDLKLLDTPALKSKIGANISNSTTLDYMDHNREEFLKAKHYLRGDYRWIDTLTFENTPDGKPVYII